MFDDRKIAIATMHNKERVIASIFGKTKNGNGCS